MIDKGKPVVVNFLGTVGEIGDIEMELEGGNGNEGGCGMVGF